MNKKIWVLFFVLCSFSIWVCYVVKNPNYVKPEPTERIHLEYLRDTIDQMLKE